jgi:hypothetical protein
MGAQTFMSCSGDRPMASVVAFVARSDGQADPNPAIVQTRDSR